MYMYMHHYKNKQREQSKKIGPYCYVYFKAIAIADNNIVCYACFDSLLPSYYPIYHYIR